MITNDTEAIANSALKNVQTAIYQKYSTKDSKTTSIKNITKLNFKYF